MKNVVLNILFVIYVIIAVLVTVCLLSYNDFKVTEFGNSSLVIITDDTLLPDYKNGDLVIVNKKDPILVGIKAFFYNTYDREIEVNLAEVVNSEKITNSETTYTLEGDHKISSEYVLGSANNATVIPGVGAVLNVLESRWGFLFIIVLPALLAFIYQISVVVSELRKPKDSKEKNKTNE